MPNLNIDYSLIIFEDESDRNPQIKLPDLHQLIQGVAVNNDKSDRITIYPNETKDIVVTARQLGWDATTQLEFQRFSGASDNMRIRHTGTGSAPIFRTKRSIAGDATTITTISRVTPYVARITNTSGTAWNLASVQVNDYIKFEKTTDSLTSPFSETNQGQTFIVQAKGAGYIDFIDNGLASLDSNITLGADFDFALRVTSQSPVKAGDTIEISGVGINPSNVGKFTVLDLSSDYIEIVSPLGVAETVTMGTNSFVIYDYLIGFVHLRCSSPIKVKFGEQVEWVKLARIGGQGLLIGSFSTHKIQAYNDTPEPVVISVQFATVL